MEDECGMVDGVDFDADMRAHGTATENGDWTAKAKPHEGQWRAKTPKTTSTLGSDIAQLLLAKAMQNPSDVELSELTKWARALVSALADTSHFGSSC